MSVLAASKSIFEPIYQVMGLVLAWFYTLVPSYGVAIILLTVAVRLVLFPLTTKQARSMQAMQRLQPEMKRLQAKYKNDRQKLNEEMMKFYKEHKVNPLAGCLPLVLQMPLFIVLYRIISGLTKIVIVGATIVGGAASPASLNGAQVVEYKFSGGRSGVHFEDGKVTGASLSGKVKVDDRIVGRLSGAHVTNGIVHGGRKTSEPVSVVNDKGEKIGTVTGIQVEGGRAAARPKHVPKDSKLHAALSRHPGHMESWGIDLAKRPSEAGKNGLGTAWPYYLFVLLVVGTGYFQQKQMTARTPASAQNQQAQMMGRIFPVFFGVISLSIPAGVVVYFIASNVWQIAQQAWIFREQTANAAGSKGSLSAGGGAGGAKLVRDAESSDTPETSEKPSTPQQARSNQQRSNRSNRRRKRRR